MAPAAALELLYRVPSGKELQDPLVLVAKALEGDSAEATTILTEKVEDLKESLRHMSKAMGPDADMVKQLAPELVSKQEAHAACVQKRQRTLPLGMR